MSSKDWFIKLPHAVYDSPAFQSLVPVERAVLFLLLRKFNGRNNGAIPLGVRDAAKDCHCGQMTACRALARLEEIGLIICTHKGHMVPEVGRPNAPSRWRVNFVKNAQNRPAKGGELHVAF